jgi:hypothetical protein
MRPWALSGALPSQASISALVRFSDRPPDWPPHIAEQRRDMGRAFMLRVLVSIDSANPISVTKRREKCESY